MKITGVGGTGGTRPVSGTGSTARASETSPVSGVSQQDRVEVSGRTAEISRFVGAAESAPDVRTEKVEPLTQQVRSGQYEVKPEKVADALVKESTKRL